MAPRATWKGHLKLGMVACQIRLYPATTESNRVSFHQLHKETLNRVMMKPHDPKLGVIDRADIVKGFEFEKDRHIVITPEDLDSVRIPSTHTIDIEAFVDAGEVDAMYLDAPYYLAPEGALADEAFLVVREAMKRANKVAIARVVMSSRERVVAITPRAEGMVMTLLRNPDEVRGTSEYFDAIPATAPAEDAIKIAERLIKAKSKHFDPKAYGDRYEIALMAMIKSKLAGKAPKVVSTAAAASRGNVVNLMEALKASIRDSKPVGKAATGKPAGGGKVKAVQNSVKPASGAPAPTARAGRVTPPAVAEQVA